MSDFPIGILVAAFNAEETLPIALDSLLTQTNDHWLAALIDDGSQDDTSKIMKRYAKADERFIFSRQDNQGSALARNAAEKLLPEAVQQLAFLDADDYLDENYVQEVRAAYQRFAPVDIVFINALRVDEGGNMRPWVERRATGTLTFEQVLRTSEFLGGGTLFSRERFRSVGGFSDSYVEDYDLWLRMMAAGAHACYCDRALYCYNIAEKGRKTLDLESNAQETIRALDRILAIADLSKSELDAIGAHKKACLLLPELSAQHDQIKRFLEKHLGPQKASGAMRIAHSFSRPLRPLRRLFARLQSGSGRL